VAPAFGTWGDTIALSASDGTPLRGMVSVPAAARGHVLLLQGRTEFLEKYAGVVAALRDRGLAVAAVDWRGQGGSARLVPDPMMGHVDRFEAFHDDLDALVAHPSVAALPGPRLMLAHSMGGCAGLGWLHARAGGGVAAAVFSAPMLGLPLRPPLGWIAPGLSRLLCLLGRSKSYAPGGGPDPYALGPFRDNLLTGDEAGFVGLGDWLRQHPQAGLGGPSVGWVAAAFRAMQGLRDRPVPVPSLFLLGSAEAVVDPAAVRRAAQEAGARLLVVDGARHECFIETPTRQAMVWQGIDSFLAEHGIGVVPGRVPVAH
jgi:lysophospholipase